MARELRPVIIDLGKQKKKRIREIERGGGDVETAVQQAIAEATANSGNGVTSGADVLPVVILYRKKEPKGSKGFGFLGPF